MDFSIHNVNLVFGKSMGLGPDQCGYEFQPQHYEGACVVLIQINSEEIFMR